MTYKPMTYEEFENKLNQSWDMFITFLAMRQEHIPIHIRNDINLFCEIYDMSYDTTIYHKTIDPDIGICFDIRNFAIVHIMALLEDALNGENELT